MWDVASYTLGPAFGSQRFRQIRDRKTNFNVFGDGFAPTLGLGLGLRSKRGHSYGRRDNVMLEVLEVHAKCEAKRTRGVGWTGE